MYKLRELDRKDLIRINSWRNDKTLIDALGAPYRFINYIIDERWYENYLQNRGSTVRCAIVGDDDIIIGLVSLTAIDHINQSAEFHIMIGPEGQGKGAGKFAVTAMLNHAFNNLNLIRVELGVLESNARAINLYEKSGFIYEGKKRCACYKNGQFNNMLIYSILKSEFKSY